MTMQITYDNSGGQPRQPPRPPRRVLWGPQSSDEMGVVWLKVVPVHDDGCGRPDADDAAGVPAGGHRRAAAMRGQRRTGRWVAHSFLARDICRRESSKEAVAELEEALRLKPGDAETHSNLGTRSTVARPRRRGDAAHLREAARLAPARRSARISISATC